MIIGVLGALLLLIVALLGRWRGSTELAPGGSTELTPTKLTPYRWRMFLVATSILAIWTIGARYWFPLQLAYLNTTSAQVSAFCVEHLHASQPVPGEYILIIEGSSVTSRGVDGAVLERSLRAAGIPITVLQLSLSGANHLERLRLLQNFASSLSANDWQRLREGRLILGHEVQALYDRNPLLNYGNNPFTASTLAYSDPDNLPALLHWMANRYDLRELLNRRSELQLVATQFLYNALRISYLQLRGSVNGVPVVAGFQPASKRPDFQPTGPLPVEFPFEPVRSGRQAYQRVTRWNTVRDAAFRSVFKGTVRSELFFSLPGWLSYEFNYDYWWSDAHPNQLFFNGNRPQIRAQLREPGLWNDPGHLASSGAEIYTEAFAEFLKEHWPVRPG